MSECPPMSAPSGHVRPSAPPLGSGQGQSTDATAFGLALDDNTFIRQVLAAAAHHFEQHAQQAPDDTEGDCGASLAAVTS